MPLSASTAVSGCLNTVSRRVAIPEIQDVGNKEEMTAKKNRKLRAGFTTGAAAAAAAKGALQFLLEARPPHGVEITFLNGEKKNIVIDSVLREGRCRAACTVIKDAGDDPDVTHKAVIGARVRLCPGTGSIRKNAVPGVCISGGVGVGTVTKPGLEVPPGEPAINKGPRKMIKQEVLAVLRDHHEKKVDRIHVEVFVPQGVELAKKTLNSRLGILGGLSILGTTGIERPMSHEAYIATIDAALSVARESGIERVVLTTGRRSERFAQAAWPEIPGEAFIQIGDFFQKSMAASVHQRLGAVMICVFFGKAVKMAQGVPHTHAAKSRLTLERLSGWALEESGDPVLAQEILGANTARHAFDILKDRHLNVIVRVGLRMVMAAREFSGHLLDVRGIIFDYDGRAVFDSDASMHEQ